MIPTLLEKGELTIAGVAGDGKETGKVWQAFIELEKQQPLANKLSDNGYEVRIYSKNGDCRCHVGVLVADNTCLPVGYSVLKLPVTTYARFTIKPANGWESGNGEIDDWLAGQAKYFQAMLGENNEPYSLLFYDERYQGEQNPKSLVDILLPLWPVCQSCSMPLASAEWYGSEGDGTKTAKYCRHCYENGQFTVDLSMAEMIEECVPYTSQNNPWPDADTARKEMQALFPKLERWSNQ